MEAAQQQLNELQAALNDLKDLQNNLGKQGTPNGDLNRTGPGMGDLGRGAGGIKQMQETDTRKVQRRAPVNTTRTTLGTRPGDAFDTEPASASPTAAAGSIQTPLTIHGDWT